MPQPLGPEVTRCDLVERWLIADELADRILRLAAIWRDRTGLGWLLMISGGRTREQQEKLAREGRPAAPWERTTHALQDARGCPRLATGADLWIPAYQDAGPAQNTMRGLFVTLGEFVGLRVGGGSPLDSVGLPTDWNHVDLGSRTD